MYFSLEWIALSNRGCVTTNVWKSRQETSKFVRVINVFHSVRAHLRFFSSGQTSLISEKTLSVAARHCSQHSLSLPETPGPGRLRQNSTILKTAQDIMLVKVVNSSTHRLSTATCSHFHLAHVKSGQIRDARPKTGQIGVPGDLLLPSCKKLEFKTVSVDGLGSGMGKW